MTPPSREIILIAYLKQPRIVLALLQVVEPSDLQGLQDLESFRKTHHWVLIFEQAHIRPYLQTTACP